MSVTPVAADHSEEFEQLAGLSALRVLDGDEEQRFERHAAQCERCRLIVRLDQETLTNLSLAAPEMDPSPDFKRRLMDRAASELAQSSARIERPEPDEPAEPIPLRPRANNVVPLWRRRAWVSSIAAVLMVALISVAGLNALQNQVVSTYAVAAGDASMMVHVRRSGAVEMEIHGVAPPPPGFVYEAWIIPPGRAPVAAGVTPTGDARMSLPNEARGSTVAVTLERGPSGSSAPTSPPLMAVVVAS